MEEDSVKITVVIPKSMKTWLDDHKEINRSKLVRNAIFSRMQPEKQKVSSLIFLVSIMGIVFSISLIGIAITPSPIHQYARAMLALLGGFLAIATSITYYKERTRITA